VLDLETDPVFTQNFDFLNEQEHYWSSRYTDERRKVLLEEEELRREAARRAQNRFYDSGEVSPISVCLPIPEPSLPQHTFPKYQYDPAIDGGETTWTVDEEIKVMANVQAYFQVAHKASIQ